MRSRRLPSIGVLLGTALWIALVVGSWYVWNAAPGSPDAGGAASASVQQATTPPETKTAEPAMTTAEPPSPAPAGTTDLAKAANAPPTASEPAAAAGSATAEPAQADLGETAPPAAAAAQAESAAAPASAAVQPSPGVRLKRPELSRLALELRVAHARLEAARTLLDNLCRLGPAEIDDTEYAGDAIAQMLVADELDEIRRVCGARP